MMFTQSYWKVELVLTDSRMMRVEKTNERVDTVISIAVLIFVPVAVVAAADADVTAGFFFMTSGRRGRMRVSASCREKTEKRRAKKREEKNRLTRVRAA
jgi:hypothetical protein